MKEEKKGLMAFKLDISKAYVRVEWSFLRCMMDRMGFSEKRIKLVMGCVSSATSSVLITGSPQGFIRPSQGLRQGCPILPYLFLLCAQGLSTLSVDVERDGLITGFSCSKKGPRVSHLLLVGDNLVFCRGSTQESHHIKELLCSYQKASG